VRIEHRECVQDVAGFFLIDPIGTCFKISPLLQFFKGVGLTTIARLRWRYMLASAANHTNSGH
jgi:hypothetical protein